MDPRTLVLLERQIKQLVPGDVPRWIPLEPERKAFYIAIQLVLSRIPDSPEVRQARTRLENYCAIETRGGKMVPEGYYDFDWMDVEDWSVFPLEEEV